MRTSLMVSVMTTLCVTTALVRCSPVGPNVYKGAGIGGFGANPVSPLGAAGDVPRLGQAPTEKTKFSIDALVLDPGTHLNALFADTPATQRVTLSGANFSKSFEALRKHGSVRLNLLSAQPLRVEAYIETKIIVSMQVKAATQLLFDQTEASAGTRVSEWELRFLPVPKNPDLQQAVDQVRERMESVTLVFDSNAELSEK